jgi:hypothetical protein
MIIKFYTNRELSRIFSINLAKWKRWSREFLPPDPLGGLQSGYARQYNLDDAFTVYLGGRLVGDLKFTIPESREILSGLHQWLLDHGFYFDFAGNADSQSEPAHPVENYQIAIISSSPAEPNLPGLTYRVKAQIDCDTIELNETQVRQERFVELSIGAQDKTIGPAMRRVEGYRVLNISVLRKSFLEYFRND